MAKRTVPNTDDDPDALAHFQVPLEVSGIEQVQLSVGDLPDAARVNLYRIRLGIKPPFAFLDEIPSPKDFSLLDVKGRFGGGEFMIRAWIKGTHGFLLNERFAIEGEPIPVRIGPAPAAAPQVVQGPAGPIILHGPGGDAALAQVITAGFAQLGQLIVQTRDRPQAHGMGGVEDTLRLVSLVKGLMGNDRNPLEMVSQVMGVIKEVRPLTGEDGKADWFSIAQTAIEKLAPVLLAGPQPGSPAALATPETMPLPAPPRPIQVEPSPVNPLAGGAPSPFNGASTMPHNQPMPQQNPVLSVVVRFGPMFLLGARQNAPLDSYADMILDALEADNAAEAAFRGWIAHPDWFAQLLQALPAAAPFWPWFQALGQQVLADLNAPPEDDAGGDGEGLPGDDGEGISEGFSHR